MMKCREVNELLVAYLDGEVSPSERGLIEAHLAGCASCQAEMDSLATVRRRLGHSLQAVAADAAPSPRAWSRLRARLAGGACPSLPWLPMWLQRLAPGVGRINRILEGGVTVKKGFALATIVVLVIAVGTMAFVPSVRAQVAAWLGFGFEQQETLPPLIVKVLDRAPWDTPRDASFEMFTIDIPQERWVFVFVERAEGDGFSMPGPGTQVHCPNGNILPVPRYLPEGYRWQGVAMHNNRFTLGFLPLGSQSGAGGGSPLPPYDRNIVNYLIGGDRADRILLLAQFKGDLDQGLLFQAYHVVSPEKQPPTPVEDAISDSPPGIVPTPTPGPLHHAAKTQVGIVIQPAERQEGLVFLVGPGELHETTVGETSAWWYQGTWNAAGEWVEDGTINLVWEQDGLTYQLTGQELALAELVRVAESLPSVP